MGKSVGEASRAANSKSSNVKSSTKEVNASFKIGGRVTEGKNTTSSVGGPGLGSGAEVRQLVKDKLSTQPKPTSAALMGSGGEVRQLVKDDLSKQPKHTSAALLVAGGIPNGSRGVSSRGSSTVAIERKTNSSSWASLFKDNRKIENGFKLSEWKDGEREILGEDLSKVEETWGICMVGYILGRFPGRKAIDDLRNGWGVKHLFYIHQSGWMIFKFESHDDRDRVLSSGPYSTFGTPWLLKSLPPFFKFGDECLNCIPTWIRLPSLPFECWNEVVLGKIVSNVGKPVATDQCTALRSRPGYARVLVEVDINKPLVKEIVFKVPNGEHICQEIVFENAPTWCKSCRRIGHTTEICKKLEIGRMRRVQENTTCLKSATQEGGPRPLEESRVVEPTRPQANSRSVQTGRPQEGARTGGIGVQEEARVVGRNREKDLDETRGKGKVVVELHEGLPPMKVFHEVSSSSNYGAKDDLQNSEEEDVGKDRGNKGVEIRDRGKVLMQLHEGRPPVKVVQEASSSSNHRSKNEVVEESNSSGDDEEEDTESSENDEDVSYSSDASSLSGSGCLSPEPYADEKSSLADVSSEHKSGLQTSKDPRGNEAAEKKDSHKKMEVERFADGGSADESDSGPGLLTVNHPVADKVDNKIDSPKELQSLTSEVVDEIIPEENVENDCPTKSKHEKDDLESGGWEISSGRKNPRKKKKRWKPPFVGHWVYGL